MTELSSQNLHGTALSISNNGVLIFGAPGSGKSDLALRLIDRGALLISDDSVIIENVDGQPVLRTAPNIGGMIEVRGLGIVEVAYVSTAPLKLIVDLNGDVPRYLDNLPTKNVVGVDIPTLVLAAFEHSTAIKVEYALKSVVDRAKS